MNKFASLSVLATALLASGIAGAATTAEMKVNGFITPTACEPTLAGGGIVDYGNVRRSQLASGTATALDAKSMSFTLTCADAAAKMSVKLTDNRQTSVVAGIVKTADSTLTDTNAFGLGSFDSKNLGAYSVKLKNVKGDTATPYYVLSRADGSTGGWTYAYNSTGAYFNKDQKAWGDSAGHTTPEAYKTITGELVVQAVLDKQDNLPAGDKIPLDGSATLEVKYL